MSVSCNKAALHLTAIRGALLLTLCSIEVPFQDTRRPVPLDASQAANAVCQAAIALTLKFPSSLKVGSVGTTFNGPTGMEAKGWLTEVRFSALNKSGKVERRRGECGWDAAGGLGYVTLGRRKLHPGILLEELSDRTMDAALHAIRDAASGRSQVSEIDKANRRSPFQPIAGIGI